ncbi:MAG: endonuclease/exonuclease/phosphatase family protein, partial [Bdellovibrionales bacterium]|nr:endonuclease/exonuclease/phosphatase family protein [Bdellovibrionales bacterium]
ENLFLNMENYKGENLLTMGEGNWQKLTQSVTLNKNLNKTWALSKAIREIKPDILLINEVGGESSLKNFNQYFLDQHYRPLIIKGNSDRGIDVGYLIKDDPEIDIQLYSHRQRPLSVSPALEKSNISSHQSSIYFSRDVLEMRLSLKDENIPCLVLLLTHLKSKLDPTGLDPQGRQRRRAELQTLVDIYNETKIQLPEETPFIVAGDFNGIAHKSGHEPEFAPLYTESDLIELFDYLKKDEEFRTTQTQFSPNGSRRLLQLDYFFLSPQLLNNIDKGSCYVYKYRNKKGEPQELSETLEHRKSLPSDHYPVVLTLKNPLLKWDK